MFYKPALKRVYSKCQLYGLICSVMNRKAKKLISSILCLLIILLPFSSISVAAVSSQQNADHQMPCHQQSGDLAADFCLETGAAQCECCDFALTAVFSFSITPTDRTLYLSSIIQDKYLESYISQSQSPPFRPPRFFV